MGFFSFLGRVLFASLFILSAWQAFNEFGVDGGPAAKELVPKFTAFKENLSAKLGVALPNIDARQLVATIITSKALGGILFVFGSSFGAYILLFYLALITPILYDFYNYSPEKPRFGVLLNDFLQNVALFGALLIFIGMKNSLPKRQIKKKAPKSKTV
ncbi:HR-like lesion-inducer [Trema orientale]|uniref:HR-like lesion-inducer n=1 Tax=Trema orientale TaxID=63057 RepID=A0A2P5FLQ4_TREOI|nr:HR-like lesion-inducer [Trema orientale]